MHSIYIKYRPLRATFTGVLLMIKVVGVIACDAILSIWPFRKVATCLVALADSFGRVIKWTLPTTYAFAITKIVVFLASVASIIIFVGGISRALAFLSGAQKNFAIFALDSITHFGLNLEFVAIWASQAYFRRLIKVVRSLARMAHSISQSWFFFWAHARFCSGVRDRSVFAIAEASRSVELAWTYAGWSSVLLMGSRVQVQRYWER